MPDFRFYYPIEVRYGDLDPQGHVNNAKYLTYIETARIAYVKQLGLFTGDSFQELGVIVADAHINFRRPILFGQTVRVGACVSRLGNKSFTMEYRIEDAQSGEELANASTVLVSFDYHANQSIPIPAQWRTVIAQFENLSES